MGFHADTFAANSTVRVDAMVYPSASPGSSIANTVGSISLANSTDGGGETNNAFKIQDITPVAIPAGVLGFLTRTRTGNTADARVYVKLRKQVGEYISSIS